MQMAPPPDQIMSDEEKKKKKKKDKHDKAEAEGKEKKFKKKKKKKAKNNSGDMSEWESYWSSFFSGVESILSNDRSRGYYDGHGYNNYNEPP